MRPFEQTVNHLLSSQQSRSLSVARQISAHTGTAGLRSGRRRTRATDTQHPAGLIAQKIPAEKEREVYLSPPGDRYLY